MHRKGRGLYPEMTPYSTAGFASQLFKTRLVILTSRFEATRGQFWGRTRNFEPQLVDEDGTCVGTPFPNFPSLVERGFKPSGPKADTLPLGHRGL
ncbi:hypothetical protein AVEN_199716-1 [Araneus ventricosus]|uniref:Uncharacterized protein n=1 Tax=Araneus ventricosus TaxID=182803 RepID=A0A4Y2RZQ5_ARAVE|nr:hypothetical protein AVEN_199716-1 [Araneus ventricosus]